MDGWVGVDLDGTIAIYDGWKGADKIGEPINLMVDRVKEWRKHGAIVKIFTARVSSNNPDKYISIKAIEEWCEKHIGEILPITSEKDYGMIELWDDRCVQVVPNKGIALQDIITNT